MDNPLSEHLLSLSNVDKIYLNGGAPVHALQSINIELLRGKTLGVAGESGSGKSTLGRLILGLERPSKGEIFFEGNNLASLSKQQSFALRRKMQVIFQDPYSSLNPRMHIEEIIGEGMEIHSLAFGKERKRNVIKLLEQVSLPVDTLNRYPHEFSGGQRQRIAIARALAVNPAFIVCDEPLSALDACTQRQVMELLLKLKSERQLSYLFISHDLNALKEISDEIIIMYLGKIVERGPTKEIFNNPKHPYTQALLEAIPTIDVNKERHKLFYT